MCCWIILGMRNVSDKICRENQNTHLTFCNLKKKSWRSWDNAENVAQPDTLRIRFARWITKATDINSEYVIIIVFSKATLVKRTRLDINLIVHFLSCYNRDAECLLRGTSWSIKYNSRLSSSWKCRWCRVSVRLLWLRSCKRRQKMRMSKVLFIHQLMHQWVVFKKNQY